MEAIYERNKFKFYGLKTGQNVGKLSWSYWLENKIKID